MTFHRKSFSEYEFTAFSGSDLLEQGDTQLSCGDTFVMPISATACITVTDNDSSLSGDAWRKESGDDRSGQTADIELNGQQVADDVKIYAECYTVVHDEDGNCYFLIEIEIAGSASDDNNDFFAFYGDVPPAGAQLSVVSTGNVCGNWLKYKKLSAGLKWQPDDNGKITIEAEDMALKGYRTDDIDDASGGEVIKLSKHEGEASLTFGAPDGVYDLELAYVDENDGQGSIVVEVNGVVVQTIQLDQDNNGNGNDHSTISTVVIENLNLTQGDTITLRGARDGYEFARIDSLSFCPDDAPVAVDDAFSVGESGLVVEDILGNDSDALTIIEANGNPASTAFTVTSTGGRQTVVIVAPNGALNFAADTAGNFEDLAVGETDTITVSYTISDGNGATDTADVVVTINGENDAPTAAADSFSVEESGLVVEDILGNDSDVDGDDLTIIDAGGNAVNTAFQVTTSGGREAVVILAESGALNFAADTAGNFEDLALGETDTISVDYTISDGNGGTSTATATVTVNGENDDPEAEDDAFNVDEGASLFADILGNDSDTDTSDTLEITSANGNAVNTAFDVTSAGGREGVAIVAASGALNLAFEQIGNFEDLAEGETDTVSFTYDITDGNGGTSSATATITVDGLNDDPDAIDDVFTAGESGIFVENLLANDSDVDASDVLQITSAGGTAIDPALGGATLFNVTSTDGRDAEIVVSENVGLNFAFNPTDEFEDLAFGETDTVTFTYDITDNNGGTDTASVTLTVEGENDDPTAVDDALNVDEGASLFADILGNDSDTDTSDTLEITSANGNAVNTAFDVTSAGGREGVAIVAASGALNLAFEQIGNFEDLAEGETDTVTFTYDITDGNGGTSSATATITVDGLNDDPDAIDDVFTAGESGIFVENLLANDSDVDASDVLQITSAGGTAIDPALGGATLFNVTSTDGRDAEIVVSENVGLNFAFNPTDEFEDLAFGETDTVTFTYDITDNNGGTDTASVTLTVEGENDDPTAVDDALNVDEGASLFADILGNDSDTDTSDTLEITSANGNAVNTAFDVTSAGGREGVAIVAASGALNLAFEQIGNFEDLAEGETDTVTFTYDITDGNGGTSSATATITVDGLNDDPDAIDDVFTAGESGIFVENLLTNDSDVDASDVLQITSAGGTAIDPALGGATLFNVTSTDGRDAEIVVSENVGLNFAFNPTDEFEDLAFGETDTVTFTYDITDNNGGTDTASVTLTVEGENDDPTAVDDALNVDEGASLFADILGNDSDTDTSDTLEITSANGNAVNTAFDVTSAGGREGVAIVAASGALNLAFEQIGNFEDLAEGETDTVSFTYDITDGNGGTSSATATITVDGLNDDPDAIDDVFTAGESGIFVENLLANDSDVDASDVLQITSAGGTAIDPALGGATLFNVTSTDGRDAEIVVSENVGLNFAFNPTDEFEDLAFGETDTVTFTYDITDNNGGTDTASVTLTVEGENDDPTAVDDALNVDEGASLFADILGNDSDTDTSDTLEITSANGNAVNTAFDVTSAGGREGVAIVAASGALNLAFEQIGNFEDLAEGETDTVTFTYDITDGNGGTSSATATITVDGLNDAPTAVDDAFQVGENVLLTVDVLGNDSDVDGTDVLQITGANGNAVSTGFSVTSAGGRDGFAIVAPDGALNLAFDQLQAFSDLVLGETDTVTITYDISDGNGGTDSADAVITVVGDGPAEVTSSFNQTTPNSADNVEIALTTDAVTDDGLVDAEIEINFVSLPDTSILAATVIAFDDSDFFGMVSDVIIFDVPGATDDPNNPDLVVNGSLATASFEIEGLASDLGDANRASLLVQFDDDNDGVADLAIFAEVDVFGFA